MDELVKELKKIYIEKLAKAYPLQRILVFFIYLLGRSILDDSTGKSFIEFLGSFKIEGFQKLFLTTTIGDLCVATVLTFLTIKIYGFINKLFFMHLSDQKGFLDSVEVWKARTEKIVTSPENNRILALEIRKRIEAKKKTIINFHLMGEVLLSVSIVLLFSLASPNNIDFIFFLLCLLSILLIQRNAYIFYLRKILPEIVSEVTLLRGDFSHQKVFVDELAENNEASR